MLQLSAQSGPCIDCFRTGSPILVPSLATASGWDSFRIEALAQGFASIHALPLRLREQTIGTLNLMGAQEGPLSEEVLVAARALADVATIGILHERSFRESELLAEQLRIALSSRVVIEQAKGVVSFTADLPIDQAFERIRSYARRNQLPLSQVAGRIVRRELHFDADSER
ncbi:GAF and ANTAR domain-containing protein [Microbacterium xylanilyticum]